MHDIEPYHKWRSYYTSAEDKNSPFHGRVYSEFTFTNKIYNYFIHPQWDSIGSETLYVKVLFADYDENFAIIELIGEWNDCIYNDIKFLKQNLIDELIEAGISKFILCCENVLNFHSSDDCYYEEWYQDISDDYGWICALNCLQHVEEEMLHIRLHHYLHLGPFYTAMDWRKLDPQNIYKIIEYSMQKKIESPFIK